MRMEAEELEFHLIGLSVTAIAKGHLTLQLLLLELGVLLVHAVEWE